MAHNTRFDKLREKLDEDFGRARTLSPAVDSGERKTLIHLDDHNDSYALPARFEKYGPFNAVTVRNFSKADIRLFLNPSRDLYIDIEADNGATTPVLRDIPKRYLRFLEIENLSGSEDVSEGDVQLIVGNRIDGVEFDLLEMSGLLNV